MLSSLNSSGNLGINPSQKGGSVIKNKFQNMVLVWLFFAAPINAYSCPDLSGEYKCFEEDNSGVKLMYKIKVSFKSPNIYTFEQMETNTIVADGLKNPTESGQGFYINYCNENAFITDYFKSTDLNHPLLSSKQELDVQGRYKVTIGKAKPKICERL